jgi:hypothetical protein
MMGIKRVFHKQYVIELRRIDRDWSEDAWEYKVQGTNIQDECEGYDEAVMYAKDSIDEL